MQHGTTAPADGRAAPKPKPWAAGALAAAALLALPSACLPDVPRARGTSPGGAAWPDAPAQDPASYALPAGCMAWKELSSAQPTPVLVKSEPQFVEAFHCAPPPGSNAMPGSGIDFSRHFLASFFAVGVGSAPQLKRLGEEQGKLVATFTIAQYCGGPAPGHVPTVVMTLVEPREISLELRIENVRDPSCDGPPRP